MGLTVGVGLEFRDTILLLVGALAVWLDANGQARELRSRWLWAGVAEHSGLGHEITYPFVSILALGPMVAVVWMAGWYGLFHRPDLRTHRCFAIASSARANARGGCGARVRGPSDEC